MSVDEELDVGSYGPADVAFVVDGGVGVAPALGGAGGAGVGGGSDTFAKSGSRAVGEADGFGCVGFYPAFVLGLLGFSGAVGEVVVVLGCRC